MGMVILFCQFIYYYLPAKDPPMPKTKIQVQTGNMHTAADADFAQSTHNTVTSNAAAKLIIKLAKKYLFEPTLLAASSSSTVAPLQADSIQTISTKDNVAAGAIVDRIASNYLKRKNSQLHESTVNYLRPLLDPEATLNNLLDKVTLTSEQNGEQIKTEWYLPLREVFSTVLKALDDLSEDAWPVPKGSTALAERSARRNDFDLTNNALAQARPTICATGIRHTWLQALDGYAEKRLPLNETDLILRELRAFTTTKILRNTLRIDITDDKDAKGEALIAFEQSFKDIFLPWLIEGKTPAVVLEGFNSVGGSISLQRSVLDEFNHIGILPNEIIKEKIKAYCSKKAFKETKCDFTPFLATVDAWLTKQAQWLYVGSTLKDVNPKEKLAKQIVNWLRSNEFSLGANQNEAASSTESVSLKHNGMEIFYLFSRLFTAFDVLHEKQELLAAADIGKGDEAVAFIEALAYLQALLTDKDIALSSLLQDSALDHMNSQLKQFEKGYTAWRESLYVDFITNFFSRWFADEKNIAVQGKLFITLSDLYFREQSLLTGAASSNAALSAPVIFLSDELIGQWRSKVNEEGVLYLQVYQVNRFILHALNYPATDWTPLFRESIITLLAFIRSGFNAAEADLNTAVRRDSYPDALLSQIDGLIAGYDSHQQEEPLTVTSQPAVSPVVLTPALISAGESLRLTDYLLSTPLVSDQLIRQLLDPNLGFDVNARDKDQLSPLHLAAAVGALTLVEALISAGADVNLIYNCRLSPLDAAEHYGHHDIVQLLLTHSSLDLYSTNEHGKLPLFIAISNNYSTDIVRRIMENCPANHRLDLVSRGDPQVLTLSADHPEYLRVILEPIPKTQRLSALKITDKYGISFLKRLVTKNPESLQIILEFYREEERLDVFNMPKVLSLAAAKPEYLKSILGLLSDNARLHNFKIEIEREYRQPALHFLARYPEALKIILEFYPDKQGLDKILSLVDRSGETLLCSLVKDIELLKIVLAAYPTDQRMDLFKITNQNGETLLHRIIHRPELLNIFFENCPAEQRMDALKLADKATPTALYLTVDYPESLKFILELLTEGQRLDLLRVSNCFDLTVLHFAVTNHPESLKVILEKFTEEQRLNLLTITDCANKTLLDLAKERQSSLKVIEDLTSNVSERHNKLSASSPKKSANSHSFFHAESIAAASSELSLFGP